MTYLIRLKSHGTHYLSSLSLGLLMGLSIPAWSTDSLTGSPNQTTVEKVTIAAVGGDEAASSAVQESAQQIETTVEETVEELASLKTTTPDDAPLINIYEAVISVPVNPNVTLDEAVQSMKLKANELNVQFAGMQSLSKAYESLQLPNIKRTEIYRFCDAGVAKRMLDFDFTFLAYMPCRIGVIEDQQGRGWLVTMNLNVFISAANLPAELQTLATKVRDDLDAIIEAGAAGSL